MEDSILNNLTESIAGSLISSINLNGHASLVVCGGNSPLQLYKNLSSKDLNWSKVSIFLGDDRIVPVDHEDSNAFLIHQHLIKNKASMASFHALLDYKDSIEGIEHPFDVVLLGLGNDGHFASLFPAQLSIPEAFNVEASPGIIVSDQELGSPSHKRISMNLSLLINAKRCILLVPSPEKRKIVEKAFTDNQLPLHFLLTQETNKKDVMLMLLNSLQQHNQLHNKLKLLFQKFLPEGLELKNQILELQLLHLYHLEIYLAFHRESFVKIFLSFQYYYLSNF